jgi:ParB-like chromosome segregation protein Spo0J
MDVNLPQIRRAGIGRSSLTISHRPVDGLKPDPANPRLHSKKQIRQIANSIEAFGFNVPILIDRDGKVICGHGRLLACRELGWTEVPTLCLDHLTPAQARAFTIADNRLTEIATWNDRLLAQQLKHLALSGLDFSLEVTGFEMGEIDLRIASLDEMSTPDDDPADAVPELSAEHCQINSCRAKGARSRMCDHTAATAFRHRFAASARKVRSVDRDTRWR